MHGDCQTSASRVALFVTSVSGFTLASMVRLNSERSETDFRLLTGAAVDRIYRAISFVVRRR